MTQKEPKRILVTGGSGFIGTHLCRGLVALGHKVTVLDLKSPNEINSNVQYQIGDIREQKTLSALLAQIDIVYHFAAIVSVELCQKDPYESYRTNFQGTLEVLKAIETEMKRSHRQIGIVFASSAAVYGTLGDDQKPISESRVSESFLSFYAAQKHASEQALRLSHQYSQVPTTIFRFFNVYGKGQDPQSPYSGVISIFTRLAQQGVPLRLNGSGVQTRDFISVHEIVNACISVLKLPYEAWDGEPINLGSGHATTIRQLAQILVRISGKNSEIQNAPPRPGDVLHSLADTKRAKEKTGFTSQTSLEDGLKLVTFE